jgi:aryl-phospho-beta-D-glucosidase BglC (GH1 family)
MKRIGRLRKLPTAVVAAALAGMAVLPAGDARSAIVSTAVPALAVRAALAAVHDPATGQPTAHDGKFWLGSQPLTLEGTNARWPCCDASEFSTIRSWGMNVVRLQFSWSRLEPNPPIQNVDGTWTHTYDLSYLDSFASSVGRAQQAGLYVVINNAGCQCSYFLYPDWQYLSPYNSHHLTYPQTAQGAALAAADFWSDPLRQQFMVDALKRMVTRMKTVAGIAGYEVLNEPMQGILLNSAATTQTILAWQLSAARAIRAVDPPRIVFFTTRSGYGPGIRDADLSGFAQLGNVAFDAHDYFGGRWGTGQVENPEAPDYHQALQTMYNNTITDNDALPAFPYIGTTAGQVRWVQNHLDGLSQWGIPLFVGEFGNRGDLGALPFWGSVTAALDATGVSWASSKYDGFNGFMNLDGTQKPWAYLVIDAADQ